MVECKLSYKVTCCIGTPNKNSKQGSLGAGGHIHEARWPNGTADSLADSRTRTNSRLECFVLCRHTALALNSYPPLEQSYQTWYCCWNWNCSGAVNISKTCERLRGHFQTISVIMTLGLGPLPPRSRFCRAVMKKTPERNLAIR